MLKRRHAYCACCPCCRCGGVDGPELANRLSITTRPCAATSTSCATSATRWRPTSASAVVTGSVPVRRCLPRFDDQEVLAVAVGLNTVAAGGIAGGPGGIGRCAHQTACQVSPMPSRLRHRLDALSVDSVPRDASWTTIPADRLTDIHHHLPPARTTALRLPQADGTESRRDIELYRVVRKRLPLVSDRLGSGA